MADDLWMDLAVKRRALIDYQQSLNATLLPADRPNYAWALADAGYEISRIVLYQDMITYGAPISFPSDAEVQSLRQAVGSLQQAIRQGSSANNLVAAATTVISTWPV